MKADKLNNVTLFASLAGGNVTCVIDGEVLWVRGMVATHRPATDYRKYMPAGSELILDDEIIAIAYAGRGHVIPYTRQSDDGSPQATATGANPDFKPTLATQAEMQMRKTMKEMKSVTRGMEKRAKRLQNMLAETAQREEEDAAEEAERLALEEQRAIEDETPPEPAE